MTDLRSALLTENHTENPVQAAGIDPPPHLGPLLTMRRGLGVEDSCAIMDADGLRCCWWGKRTTEYPSMIPHCCDLGLKLTKGCVPIVLHGRLSPIQSTQSGTRGSTSMGSGDHKELVTIPCR